MACETGESFARAVSTTTKQQQDLTRMKDDHDDDADSSRTSDHLGPENRSVGFQQTKPGACSAEGAAMPTEPIRVIVFIVVHPREVFGILSGTRLL
jgi:hypothetical protein